MRIALLLVLLLTPAALAADAPHVVLAQNFRRAFDAKDVGTMATIAAQPASKVPYALVLFTLLEGDQFEAAAKLVELRGGAPEGPGLERLLKGHRAGIVANDRDRQLWRQAEALLGERNPDGALKTLDAAGKPREGTVTGARMAWTRAVAHGMRKDWETTVQAMREAAKLARMVGWLQQSLMADTQRLRIARQFPEMQKDAVAAASGVIQDAQALADRQSLLNGLLARATIYGQHSNVKEARQDYAAALEKARELNLHSVEGRILTNLGSMAQVFERSPERARRSYADAIAAFERAGDTKSIPRVRLNLSSALTQMGRYDDALSELDKLDKDPGGLERAARAQRGYIRRRQGRLERSRALYRELLESATTAQERQALSLDLGDLALSRGDYRGARTYFVSSKAEGTSRFRALAGEAAALGGLQDIPGCREKFRAAVEAAPTPEEKGRVELQWAAFERSFGRIKQAIELVNRARTHLAREDSTDYGNGAAAWVITADLLLLDGQRVEALKPLAAASVFFTRLQDAARAIPAFARESLVLMGFEKIEPYMDDVTKRRGTLLHLVEGTNNAALRSMGATVDGVYLHKRGTPEEGNKRFAEAIQIAREAGLPDREAAALAAQALFAGANGLNAAIRAAALRKRRPEQSIEVHPVVVGERGDGAPSIALRSLLAAEKPDPAVALPLVEVIKSDQMQLALRGRDAILVRVLPEADYVAYVDKRGALREARAAREGVEAAEEAFVAELDRLRPLAPLAFGGVPTLPQVQAVLRKDELLLLYVDDAFARGVLAIDQQRAELRAFDPAKPFAELDSMLTGKQTLLVAPGGFLSLDTATWKNGIVSDAFSIQYCASAASVIAQRSRPAAENPAAGDRAVVREVENSTRIGLQHAQVSDVDLSPREAARVVIYGRSEPSGVGGSSGDGIACIADPRLRAGADYVLISFLGNADERIVARFRQHLEKDGKSAPEALQLTRRWARTQEALKDPRHWAALVLWGAP